MMESPFGRQIGEVLALLALCFFGTMFAVSSPAVASAAECTDTWTGPSEGSWDTPANWSGGVPSEADVVCVGSGDAVDLGAGGSYAVASIHGEGSFVVKNTPLRLTDLEDPSEMAALVIKENGRLRGPGTLQISESLTVEDGTFEESGTVELGTGAVADFSQATIWAYTFINQGTVTLTSSYLEMAFHASFDNYGTLALNSEGREGGITRPNYFFEEAPTVVNHDLVEKTEGTGTTAITAEVENFGTIDAVTGRLQLTSNVDLKANSQLEGHIRIEGEEDVAESFSSAGGTLELHPSQNLIIAPGDVAEVENLIIAGQLGGEGELLVTGSLTWEEGTMLGSGTTRLGPEGTGTISGGNSIWFERTFVNEGTITYVNSYLLMAGGSLLDNKGIFKANAQGFGDEIQIWKGEPQIINSGVFEKTEGTGTTWVEPDFYDVGSGSVRQLSGTLRISRPQKVAASTATPNEACGKIADPVECATGNFTEAQTDLAIGGLGVGLDLTRTYNALAAAEGATGIFGHGWTNSFGDRLTSEEGGAKVTLTDSSGSTTPFTRSGTSYLAPSWSRDKLTSSTEAGFTLTLPDQTEETFSGGGRLESVTDRNGNETVLGYEGSGRLETITDPTGRTITLAYNGSGLVESAEDPMGHVVHYTYESGNLKTVKLPGESSPNWTFGYDGSHRVTSMIDGRGGETTNEYDGSGRVIKQVDPAKHETTFAYEPFQTTITNQATGAVTHETFNSNNQPVSITHGSGTADATTEAFGYTAAGLLACRTDGNGHTTTYGYDGHGNRTSVTDALEHETTWTYNEAHQVLTTTKPSGEKTTIVRDADGNPETVSRPAPGKEAQTVSYEYGLNGEVESKADPLGNTWTYVYDAQGDLESEIDPEGDERTWTYDEDSRVLSTVSPRGNETGAEAAEFTTAIERDPRGRPIKVIDPTGGLTEFVYDPDGNLESLTDPNGHTTTFTYNADDERIKVERPNGDIEETGYDGAGQITSQVDGEGDETTYVRNVLEEPVETINPLKKTTTRTFDAAGNLETKEDPDGRTTSYGYDKDDRLKEISCSTEAGHDVTFGYDEDGDLTSMEDGTGKSTYEYDQLDRLTHSENGNGETIAWEYNLGDEPVGLTYPNGKSISREYDEDGRLESLTDWLGHTTTFSYNPDSGLAATTFPVGTSDKDEFSYDQADRMSGVTMKKGAETLASVTYTRDPAGQLESLISKGLPGAEEESFGYDENEWLTEAGAANFEYDAANNLTKAPGTTNAFDKAGQLETATGATFSYDEEGERTHETPSSGPATTYKYDQAGHLTAVERSAEGGTPAIGESFGYDGGGLMASKTVGLSTRHIVWDLISPPARVLSDGENTYLYGPDGLAVEQISSGETPIYLHHDQLGSTRVLTNASGEVAATMTYGPYGDLAGKTGTSASGLGLAGQYTLGQSDLEYLRARFYDPATAQFLTSDPLQEVTRAPYSYANGNPIGNVDRRGLEVEESFPCVWPVCSPPPSAVEPIEDVVNGAGSVAETVWNWMSGESSDDAEIGAESQGAQSQESPCPQAGPPAPPDFNDPSQPPGAGWEWRGNGPPGSSEGSWYNPGSGESLHPDLEHEPPIGPHYDWLHPGGQFRVYPGGRVEPK